MKPKTKTNQNQELLLQLWFSVHMLKYIWKKYIKGSMPFNFPALGLVISLLLWVILSIYLEAISWSYEWLMNYNIYKLLLHDKKIIHSNCSTSLHTLTHSNTKTCWGLSKMHRKNQKLMHKNGSNNKKDFKCNLELNQIRFDIPKLPPWRFLPK